MTNIVVKAEHISKTYGKIRALDDLEIRVPEYSVTAILGPNGAGKSTFFRMISGMVAPDSGRLEVLGRKPGWRLNRSIAYLPDRARWYGEQTVKQALAWAGRLLPDFNRERAWSLVRAMGLSADMKAGDMSRGQEARLMLAICVARDVPFIVLDEPFAGIDLISRERIVSVLIDSLSERKQTVLISTHEIGQTESLFDYAVFLSEGRARLAGDAEQLRAEYGSMETIYRRLFQ